MDQRRLELQDKFQEFIGIRSDGKANVFFQPKESTKLVYPCIVYSLTRGLTHYANNMPYHFSRAYDVTIITLDADDPLINKMAYGFPKISQGRPYVSENLYHYPFTLYD